MAGQERKIALEPNARSTVGFELSTDDLTSLGPELSPCLEPRRLEIQVGGILPDTDHSRQSFASLQNGPAVDARSCPA
jgi:hypothetical protein